MEIRERFCGECARPLKGRLDKKFCDDFCRNAYNNKLNSDRNNYVRNINNVLRRNRRLLESVIYPREMGKCLRRQLADAGFDFRFHTHQQTDPKGSSYVFCYDYGYLPIEEDWLLIIRSRQQHGGRP